MQIPQLPLKDVQVLGFFIVPLPSTQDPQSLEKDGSIPGQMSQKGNFLLITL